MSSFQSDGEGVVTADGPFTIKVHKLVEEDGTFYWMADFYDAGQKEDEEPIYMTHGYDPIEAVFMAHDLLMCISNRCVSPHAKHCYCRDTPDEHQGNSDKILMKECCLCKTKQSFPRNSAPPHP